MASDIPLALISHDVKDDIVHFEHDNVVELDKAGASHEGQAAQKKSTFDTLTWWQTIKTFKRAVLICGVVGISAATDGYQNQLNGSIIAHKGFISQMALPGKSALEPAWVSSFGGAGSGGSILGQFGIQYINEWFGRKIGLWTLLFGLTIATVIEATATQWWIWTIAKVIAGASVGAVQASLPLYINEQAPTQIRGFLIVAYSLWFTLGGLMASIGLKFMQDANPLDYRTPIYTQFGMIGASAVIFFFLPESPWWLVSKGKMEHASKVLKWKYGNIPGYSVKDEVAIIAATIEQQRIWRIEQGADGHWGMLKGLNLKRFLIGSYPKVLQQFVGLSVFSNYSAYFFQLAGNSQPFLVTIWLGIASLVSVMLDAALVDRIGRRRMTLIGFGGACFGVALMAIVGCFDYTSKELGSVLVFAGVAANFFNTFQSSTSYAYLTEMPEQRWRAQAIGWGLAYCNCYSLLFSFTVPLMLAKWVVKTAFLFVCLGVPGTVIAYFIMPESAQRSPAEIDEMFVEGISLRAWRGHTTSVERDLDARRERGDA